MQIDLPLLAEGVRLDEMALVMDMKSMFDRVHLLARDETVEIDYRHGARFAQPRNYRNGHELRSRSSVLSLESSARRCLNRGKTAGDRFVPRKPLV
jgi:hypothetical protein